MSKRNTYNFIFDSSDLSNPMSNHNSGIIFKDKRVGDIWTENYLVEVHCHKVMETLGLPNIQEAQRVTDAVIKSIWRMKTWNFLNRDINEKKEN